MMNKIIQFYTISEMNPQIKWLILMFLGAVAVWFLLDFIMNNIGSETDGVMFEISIPFAPACKEQVKPEETVQRAVFNQSYDKTSALICDNCGAPLNRGNMECEYCGVKYR